MARAACTSGSSRAAVQRSHAARTARATAVTKTGGLLNRASVRRASVGRQPTREGRARSASQSSFALAYRASGAFARQRLAIRATDFGRLAKATAEGSAFKMAFMVSTEVGLRKRAAPEI